MSGPGSGRYSSRSLPRYSAEPKKQDNPVEGTGLSYQRNRYWSTPSLNKKEEPVSAKDQEKV
jgi:hypothetical protein